jgi:hypothetical protein
MKRNRIVWLLALVLLGWSFARSARAVDDPVEFLRALQGGGYPDVAVDYLNALKDNPKAPKEILDVWDWEMSKSLRAASKWAYNETEVKRYAEQAEAHLKKFIDENPKRPEAIRAGAEAAATLAEEAVRELRKAKEMTDKEKRVEAMESVRGKLLGVRGRFVGALQVNVARLKKTPAKDRRRQDREDDVLDGRVKVAMVDFYVGLTYPKTSPERATNMEAAAKEFDDLYQANRNTPTLWSLTAHYFNGRCKQEEGKLADAKDIYEEVLVADTKDTSATPDNPKAVRKQITATPLDDLLAEVEQHDLECILAEDLKGYLKEVSEWRTQHKPLERRDGYQAISFDLAKVCLRLAGGEKTSAADKKRYTAAATHVLSDMVKIPSQYQAEAIKLRRQLLGGSDADEGLDEVIERADEAAQAKKWSEAVELYQKALEAAAKSKDAAKRVPPLYNAVAVCYCNIGLEAFRKGDLPSAAKAFGLILEDEHYQTTPTAASAGALLLNVLLNQYNAMEEGTDEEKAAKLEARKKMEEAANKIIARWPGRPEADAARLAKARLLVLDANTVAEAPAGKSQAEAVQQRVVKFLEKMKEATAIFKEINPKSEHYVTALYLTGYTYWRRYRLEKREIEGIEADSPPASSQSQKLLDETKAQIDLFRQTAVKVMQRAVETLKATPPQEGKKQLVTDSKLLLAEMLLDQGDPKASAALFQELIDEREKAEIKGLDPTALQICNGAVQAYLLMDDIDKAGKVSKLLLKLGPDASNVNFSLTTFGRKLEAERNKAQTALDAAKTPSEVEAAKKKRDLYDPLLTDLLENLAERTKLTPASMVWIAQTAAALGMSGVAEKVAKQFQTNLENDEWFAKEGAKGAARISSLLISILRQRGKFDEATAQVEALIAQKPKALEPQMERCLILQTWAEKNAEKYPDAVHAWEGLRRKLEKVGVGKATGEARKKPRELYDVTYNEAQCLYKWAKKAGDKKNAKDGLQLLKQMLLLDPKLNGPDTVSRFILLANQLELLLGMELTKKPGPAAPAKKADAPKPNTPKADAPK